MRVYKCPHCDYVGWTTGGSRGVSCKGCKCKVSRRHARDATREEEKMVLSCLTHLEADKLELIY